MKDYLLLIDGSGLLCTQYFGHLPTEILFAKTPEEKEKYYYKIMQTSKGVYTNGVFGFMRTLTKIVREQKPAYIAVAWDSSRDTFRRELYSDYKGNRSDTPKPLGEQFATCQNALERMGIRQFMNDRYEADDFCGTLARRFEHTLPVRILTKDNDYLQLVTPDTNLWMMHSTPAKTDALYAKYHIAKDGSAPERTFTFTPELVEKEFGVEPASIADLKGLQGDSSDNIKGVPGVGPATAAALIAKYKTVEHLYEAMEGLDEKELKNLAASWKAIGVTRSPVNSLLKTDPEELVGREAAYLSKKLATIKCDIDLEGLTLDDLKLNIDRDGAARVFEELEFRTLKPDFGTEQAPDETFTYKLTNDLTEVEELVSKLTEASLDGARHAGRCLGFAVLVEDGELKGAALTTDENETIYIRAEGFINSGYIGDMLARLDDSGAVLAGFDIKTVLKFIPCKGFLDAFDVSVAQYLIDPLKGDYGFNAASGGDSEYLTALESRSAYREYKNLKEQLEQTGMDRLFYEIEMPLVYTLNSMELEGIMVRREELAAFGQSLDGDISRLEHEIYDYVGETFNINSPKQLGVILFEKLHLPYGKKTKTGYSTSADVLEKLKIEDPVVEKILDYRQLTKLKSTYADGLCDYIDADERIRTTFNQTVTATGRLSSTDPNLQNIPIRTELGRELRKVFVAKEGCVFVDADYSQIELRILAALSGDEKLISAYRNAEDIHRATASAVFHVPYELVTPELRSRAKAVNFGIVYGISSFGLGNGLNISRKEAESYISQYFETYPQIKAYLDGLVTSARDKGYAVTAFGRRRPIPELQSANFMQRQFGERIAMNSPIQGTAADIIKIAMIRVDSRLKAELPEAKLVLQVHDELLVETPEEAADAVRAILIEEMQRAADLSVGLEVGIESGRNWFEAH